MLLGYAHKFTRRGIYLRGQETLKDYAAHSWSNGRKVRVELRTPEFKPSQSGFDSPPPSPSAGDILKGRTLAVSSRRNPVTPKSDRSTDPRNPVRLHPDQGAPETAPATAPKPKPMARDFHDPANIDAWLQSLDERWPSRAEIA